MTTVPTSHTSDDLDVGLCPAWCTLPAGHPWDSTWPDGTVSRGHEGRTDSVTDPDGDRAYVSLSALERRGHGVGRVGVSVHADATLTAPQARELAALLLAAADRLDEVTR